MTRRIWIFIMYTATFSLLFSYENKFSYNNGTGSDKISLSHSPELTEINGGYTRLAIMGDGHTTEAGMPELPQFTTYYQLDPSKTYEFQFEIVESYTIEDIIILPHQNMDKWEVDAVSIINEEVYNSYAAFPEQNMVVSERSQGRGIEFISIHVIPYTYYPKYQRLEVYSSIDIQIIETGENPGHELHQPKRSHIFDEYYKDLIVNFTYSDRPDDYQAPAILYIGGGSSLSNSYVQDLIEWRHKQGYIIYTATESEVGGSSASTTEIKNYISDAYYGWNPAPEIVGLIGDTGGSYSLPNFSHSWSGYGGPTDFDYTQLDGNDLIPEVFIGRISGSSSSDLNNIINKTIHYEKADYVDNIWFSKAGLVGDPDESGNSTIFTNQYIENMMINHGMNRVQTDYDGSGTQTFMEEQFNDGILYYNYRGYYYGYGSYPTNSINNGYNTPFVTTITCGTGDYDGTASSEEFVRLGSTSNPKGAVGAVGMATIGTHTMYNNIVDMGIYDGIFSKKLWLAGAAVANGHAAIVATYPTPNSAANAAEAFSKWSNLIGDPALHLWVGEPENFSISYPTTIILGTNTIEVIVNDDEGNPVENARVTLLMGNDDIFTSVLSDDHGSALLIWEAIQSGSIDLTVIKRNYIPYEGSIEIADAAGAAIAMNSGEIYADAGESTNFEISLHNYGNATATGVIAELSSSSEHITIDNANISYGTIMSGATIYGSFPVTIHGTAFDMEDLECTLTIKDDSDNIWVNYVPVNISGSHLVISDYSGETLPGATTDLAIDLINEGSRAASNFTLELLPYENLITINEGWAEVDNLSAGSNILLDGFDLSFNSTIINGSVIPMELILTSSDGFTRNQIINVTIGETRETDPLGPDLHGYYIYDAGDTEYEFAPVYDWIEIAEGLGNQLSISDGGNGTGSYQNGSVVLDLPFIFTFYGVDYDKIVVNTNGWISFGHFEMYSFRNYPLPGAGGPSPMVAAFWDDLKTGSSGYVYHYETDEMVVIQWDYMRTYDSGSRETFEIILYNKENNTPTSTGDSEIKIQYQDFNNTSDGNYTSYTPSHGCYSTVGIESHLGDMGLEYTFNNSYPQAAATIQDGSAIFITTDVAGTDILGCIDPEADNYNPDATADDGSCFYLGDLNNDGLINVLDVVVLVNIVLGQADQDTAGDLNSDGLINVLDVVILVNIILS